MDLSFRLHFSFDENNLYARTNDDFVEPGGKYIVWNLKTDKWKFYNTSEEYLKEAKANNYPRDFKDFQQHYSDYWHGWRFFLLP